MVTDRTEEIISTLRRAQSAADASGHPRFLVWRGRRFQQVGSEKLNGSEVLEVVRPVER